MNDDPSGVYTSCDVILCGENEYVLNHICTSCEPGTTNEAGDDASRGNTSCDVTLCNENEYVKENIPFDSKLLWNNL